MDQQKLLPYYYKSKQNHQNKKKWRNLSSKNVSPELIKNKSYYMNFIHKSMSFAFIIYNFIIYLSIKYDLFSCKFGIKCLSREISPCLLNLKRLFLPTLNLKKLKVPFFEKSRILERKKCFMVVLMFYVNCQMRSNN